MVTLNDPPIGHFPHALAKAHIRWISPSVAVFASEALDAFLKSLTLVVLAISNEAPPQTDEVYRLARVV
jgi:hypothetical protein